METHRERSVHGRLPSSSLQQRPDSYQGPRTGPRQRIKRRRSEPHHQCLPSTRTLQRLGIIVSALLLVLTTILVQLLIATNNNRPIAHRLGLLSGQATSHRNSSSTTTRFQHKVYRKHQRKPPILVVGLPKAGTSSLFFYFQCLGFHAQHWYCCGPQQDAQQEDMPAYMSECMMANLRQGLGILDGCGDYDVYTEMNGPRDLASTEQPRIFLPQMYQLQELHNAEPDATWILNTRFVADWVESVSRVPAKMLTKQFFHEAQAQEPSRWATTWGLLQPHRRRPDRSFLQEFYEAHIRRIHDFVQVHPSHSLITLNISDPHAGEILGRALHENGIRFPVFDGRDDTTFLSRSKACWAAHNVRQHG